MGAKVLKMEGITQPKQARARKFSGYTEDPQARYLFMAEDAHGKPRYFFKIQVTGLKDRMFGPYARRSMAIAGFDTVLGGALEAFCELQNSGRHRGDGMEHPALPTNLKPVPMR
jgi:hypothetical protein